MIYQDTVLLQLIVLIERIGSPPPPLRPRRGRPIFYSEKLFMKALVIMIVRRLHRVGELLAVVEEPTPEMKMVRQLLSEQGRFPTRRTFQRRLKALPERLPKQIGCLGRYVVEVLKPWESRGRAVAPDSTVLQAKDGVWHNVDQGCEWQEDDAKQWQDERVESGVDEGRPGDPEDQQRESREKSPELSEQTTYLRYLPFDLAQSTA